ncbi:MAG: hypothetical protein HY459_02460 [Parcubacteria group bacterium]|nr:hypothetical protein [Parcubacteria group bacterium]
MKSLNLFVGILAVGLCISFTPKGAWGFEDFVAVIQGGDARMEGNNVELDRLGKISGKGCVTGIDRIGDRLIRELTNSDLEASAFLGRTGYLFLREHASTVAETIQRSVEEWKKAVADARKMIQDLSVPVLCPEKGAVVRRALDRLKGARLLLVSGIRVAIDEHLVTCNESVCDVIGKIKVVWEPLSLDAL